MLGSRQDGGAARQRQPRTIAGGGGAAGSEPAPPMDPGPRPGPAPSEATPRGFKRKIAVLSRGGPEAEGGGAGAPRKRRWGATAPKKPSLSISTDSLKGLIPDFRGGGAEPPEPLPLCQDLIGGGAAEGAEPARGGGVASSASPAPSPGAEPAPPHPPLQLKICRTVTQVVPPENGREEEELSDEGGGASRPLPPPGHAPAAGGGATPGHAPPPPAGNEGEGPKGDAPPPPGRRPLPPWRPGLLLVPVDEPVRAAPRPSPPRQRPSNIVHLCNLVRPFTLGQLKELLGRTGRLKDDGFWIDRIKSHCFVTYCSVEEAVATREALHGVKWPQSNPKVLAADFAQQEELDFHRGLLAPPRWAPPRGGRSRGSGRSESGSARAGSGRGSSASGTGGKAPPLPPGHAPSRGAGPAQDTPPAPAGHAPSPSHPTPSSSSSSKGGEGRRRRGGASGRRGPRGKKSRPRSRRPSCWTTCSAKPKRRRASIGCRSATPSCCRSRLSGRRGPGSARGGARSRKRRS